MRQSAANVPVITFKSLNMSHLAHIDQDYGDRITVTVY